MATTTIQNLTTSGIVTRDVATLGVPTAPEERFQAFLKSFERSEVKEAPAQAVGRPSPSHDVKALRAVSPQRDTAEASSDEVGAKQSTVAARDETTSKPESHIAAKTVFRGSEGGEQGLHASEATQQPSSPVPNPSRSSRASVSDTEKSVPPGHASLSEDASPGQVREGADPGMPQGLSGSAVSDNKTTIAERGSRQPVSGVSPTSGPGQPLSPASGGAAESESAKMELSAQSAIVDPEMSPEIGTAIEDMPPAAPVECLSEAPSKLETNPDNEVRSAPVVEQEDAETNASELAQRTGLRALVSGAGATVETHVEQDLGEGHRLVIHMGPAGESGKQSLKVHATDTGMNASLASRLDDLRTVVQNAAGAAYLTDHAAEMTSSNIELAVMETPIRLNRKVENPSVSSEVENAGNDAKSPSKSVFVSLLDVIA